MRGKKFRVEDYNKYNRALNLHRYKYLHDLYDAIFKSLPFDENDFPNDFSFKYDNMIIYIDKKFGSQAEIINTARLPIKERIKLHEKKLKQYNKNIIQWKLF